MSTQARGNAAAATAAAIATNDEFGDLDDILDDFDVDAAVAAAGKRPLELLPAVASASAAATATATATIATSAATIADARTPARPLTKRAKVSPDLPKSLTSTAGSLEACLQRYFGFSDFRTGQEEAIQAVLRGQDVAIFWATGSGKSITFQLPPLYLNKVAIVVSPLISLMQDQVHKLNGLSEERLATYLGSAQLDPDEERKALRGEYKLVFVTPEKLQKVGFLDQIAKLDLCLIAIDESHCVSNWGHDFRPEYRQAGESLRGHAQLSQIPLIALTATAMPRIQEDVIQNLRMRNVFKCQQTFDRHNLNIKVLPKDGSGGALRRAMEPLVRSLTQSPSSTIVYAPTKNQVEELAAFLQQRLQAEGSPVQVDFYHGGLTPSQRQVAHLNFLTGRSAVVVATLAFGMGIDKPDTRRVIHFGPPQTVEEYYQQIGRAGRDGLPAECLMYASPADFDKYQSDFYIGDLSGPAREASIQSTKALKSYALGKETCRRKALLEFFHERPTFGEHCGTCDVCRQRRQYGDDASRDFGPVARLVLEVVSQLNEPSMTTVMQVLGGKIVEDYRYAYGQDPHTLKAWLEDGRKALDKKFTVDQLKELATALIQKKYIEEVIKRATVGGYNRSWATFHLTTEGERALKKIAEAIVLPVPESIREAERQAEQRRQRVLKELQDSGISLDKLPQQEVEEGDGEVIRAYTKWNTKIRSLEGVGDDRLAQAQELLQLIEQWRSDAAERMRMAPASVLAEHILYSIAYTVQSFPSGMQMDEQALKMVGARTREVASLVDVVNSWLDRYKPSSSTATGTTDVTLSWPHGDIQPNKWAYAVYKPQKKTGLASWESSYTRFSQGESPATIAMSPQNGKPLAVRTVVGHIMEAFVQGRPVNLASLASISSPPTQSQWNQLEEAERQMAMTVDGDPTTCGANGGKYTMTDLLRPIMGATFADTPYAERSEEDKESFSQWCERLKWYELLKRAGVEPNFY